jgi:isoamylase
MDSLRYWITEMHVDGFRFDLASTLARELHDVDRLSTFFGIIHQDPVISTVKLIAEPWDVGEGGYQVGNFPVLWTEWNDRYRDTVRRYWRGDRWQLGELARRLSGSSDLYQEDGRKPYSSINLVTAHDGFTLHDLVSYSEKHNEENGENNQDGHSENLSYNYGVEGETNDRRVIRTREQQKRNFLATLLLSQGVPMIYGGDEIGRTQRGNNNAYCQDNEISWYDWDLDDRQRSLLEFTRRMIRIRHEQPALRRRKFLKGKRLNGSHFRDVTWLRPDGREMRERNWHHPHMRSFGFRLAGDALDEYDREGRLIEGDTLLVLMNASKGPVSFALPRITSKQGWMLLVDTARPEIDDGPQPVEAERYELGPRSLAMLKMPRGRSSRSKRTGDGSR